MENNLTSILGQLLGNEGVEKFNQYFANKSNNDLGHFSVVIEFAGGKATQNPAATFSVRENGEHPVGVITVEGASYELKQKITQLAHASGNSSFIVSTPASRFGDVQPGNNQ